MNFLNFNINFYSFLQMVKLSGLVDKLNGRGPFKVLVPHNDAFGEIPSPELTQIMNDEDDLKSTIMCHILEGKYRSEDLSKKISIKALNGLELDITLSSEMYINDARIINSDISLSNGVVHIVDQVIRPPDLLAPI
ncbi:MAG: fasciclin domain-containing protein [Promethearchaeia archaeon]